MPLQLLTPEEFDAHVKGRTLRLSFVGMVSKDYPCSTDRVMREINRLEIVWPNQWHGSMESQMKYNQP